MALEDTTIARPYAEAAYAVARESKQQDTWGAFLAELAVIMASPDMIELAANTTISRDKVVEVISSICQSSVKQQQKNLLQLLCENGRLAVAPDLYRLYEELRKQDEDKHQILLRTALPMTDKELQAIEKALKSRLGGTVDLQVETDESLLGGAEIRIGDLVIDDTIRGRLTQLAQDLQN